MTFGFTSENWKHKDPSTVSIINVAVTHLVVSTLNSNRDTTLRGCMQVFCLSRCVPRQDRVVSCWKIALSDSYAMSCGNHAECFDT